MSAMNFWMRAFTVMTAVGFCLFILGAIMSTQAPDCIIRDAHVTNLTLVSSRGWYSYTPVATWDDGMCVVGTLWFESEAQAWNYSSVLYPVNLPICICSKKNQCITQDKRVDHVIIVIFTGVAIMASGVVGAIATFAVFVIRASKSQKSQKRVLTCPKQEETPLIENI